MSDFDHRLVFKEWEVYDLSIDSAIDKYALDIEAENQPHLMNKWLTLLAQAQADLSKCKEALQNVEAELFIEAKQNGIPGIGKPTDATVKAWVTVQDKYRRIQRKKRTAENNVAYLQNARSVLEHRKNMIKVEADLWITGYFARPNMHGVIKEELETERREEHSKRLKVSLQKRHLRKGEDDVVDKD